MDSHPPIPQTLPNVPLPRPPKHKGLKSLIIGVEIIGLVIIGLIIWKQVPSTTPVPRPTVLSSPQPKAVKKLAVILVKVSSDPQPLAVSVDDLKKRVFTAPDSLAAYWRENSNGAWDIRGDVYGPISIQVSNYADCTYEERRNQANAALKGQGIDTSTYTDFVYVINPPANCQAGLTAAVGEGEHWTVVPAGQSEGDVAARSVLFHESGHLLGQFQHAGSLDCPAGTAGQKYSLLNCTGNEYGDFFDVMGRDNTYNFNGYHRAEAGFLAESQIQKVSATGDYTLTSADTAGTTSKLVQIELPNLYLQNSLNLGPYYLYLDQRSQTSTFNTGGFTQVTSGLSLYIGHDYHRTTAEQLRNAPIYRLLVPTTGSDLGGAAILRSDGSYTDPTGRVTVSHVQVLAAKTTFHLVFNY